MYALVSFRSDLALAVFGRQDEWNGMEWNGMEWNGLEQEHGRVNATYITYVQDI